jgi:hypothetical protein
LTGTTATLLYGAVAVLMTWPLATGLARDIPWDLGDSVLNCWILGWSATHFLRILSGDLSAAPEFWNANIFYPEPLTLAYSEHLAAQAIQILPIYALTGNLILGYNLLFLSTFVLSGVGMFLLVRDITGSVRAAFLAGLFYGFAPYRVAQSTHLQVLSSQWMPFALFGLRRYLDTGRPLPLAGATASLIAQNLSCGYYLLFFSPVVPLYCVWELWARARLRDRRAWSGLAIAGFITLAATWPFLEGYRALRKLGHEARAIQEVIGFSADVYSYFTTAADVRVWGDVARAFVKPEGELFPGAIPIALGVLAIAWQASRGWRETPASSVHSRGPLHPAHKASRGPQWPRSALSGRWAGARHAIAIVAAAFAVIKIATAIAIVAGYGGVSRLGPLTIRMSNFYNEVWRAVLASVVVLVLSPRARVIARRFAASPTGWFAIATILAAWLSLGPIMHTMGRRVAAGPYLYLHEHVPGFDGLRVPARFGMIVMLCLAVLGGIAAAVIERRSKRGGGVLAALGVLFLVEALAAPIPLNVVTPEQDVRAPSPRLRTGHQIPAVYRFLQTLPSDAVIVEFPFGTFGHDLQYMYYSTFHWRRMLNGYSGFFPRSFSVRQAQFGQFREDPETAWNALALSGATYAIVHESAYPNREAEAVIEWLQRRAARRVRAFGRDVVFELPRR